MEPARRLATYEDLLDLPEDVRAEVLEGMVITSPPPHFDHSHAQGGLSHFIGGPFHFQRGGGGGPGGWWILGEIEVRFDRHNIVRPDVAGWRRERLPEPRRPGPIEVIPDWIAEVISSSNASNDRVRKRKLYAARGVPYYWLLDPIERSLEVLRLEPERHIWIEIGAYGDSDVARIPPFDAIELEVGLLFPPKPAPREGAPERSE